MKYLFLLTFCLVSLLVIGVAMVWGKEYHTESPLSSIPTQAIPMDTRLTAHQTLPVGLVGTATQSSIISPDHIKVGQWVKYHIKRYLKSETAEKDTPETISEGTVKISITGSETVIENEYLWVEFIFNEGKEEQRVLMIMIDKEGTPQRERLVLKYGKLPAVEIHLGRWEVRTRITRDMLFEEMTSELNIIPFTRILSPEAYDETKAIYENLPIKIGDKKETVLKSIKVLLKQFGAEAPEGSVWYSNAVPLAGLVKLFLIEDRYRTMILLSDYGQEGAKSCITETPIKLDFRQQD